MRRVCKRARGTIWNSGKTKLLPPRIPIMPSAAFSTSSISFRCICMDSYFISLAPHGLSFANVFYSISLSLSLCMGCLCIYMYIHILHIPKCNERRVIKRIKKKKRNGEKKNRRNLRLRVFNDVKGVYLALVFFFFFLPGS